MPQFQDRTIEKFKKQLKGGGSRSNLFEVSFGSASSSTFTLPPTGDEIDTDDYMMIKSAGLPASTITEIPVPFRGRTLKHLKRILFLK